MRRVPSPFKPDNTLDAVVPNDIGNNVIEDRHIANDEIRPLKIAMVENNTAVPVIFTKEITTGSASEKILDANAPFKFEVLDVIVQPRGASTNGTMKVTDGTDDITDAMVAAVDKTIARAATIDAAYSTIAKGGSLVVVCAGDTIGDTKGIVTVIARKVD